MTNLRTCNNCGWVHFGVTRKHAEDEVKRFNEFYHTQSKEVQDMYGGESSIKNYEYCFRCGGLHTNMRVTKDGDCPGGCTIQPIIMGE